MKLGLGSTVTVWTREPLFPALSVTLKVAVKVPGGMSVCCWLTGDAQGATTGEVPSPKPHVQVKGPELPLTVSIVPTNAVFPTIVVVGPKCTGMTTPIGTVTALVGEADATPLLSVIVTATLNVPVIAYVLIALLVVVVAFLLPTRKPQLYDSGATPPVE